MAPVGDEPARFRVRGYLTAQPTEDGQTALAFIWKDVYDATKQRAQRVQGESLGKAWRRLRPLGRRIEPDHRRRGRIRFTMDAIASFLVTIPPGGAPVPGAPVKDRWQDRHDRPAAAVGSASDEKARPHNLHADVAAQRSTPCDRAVASNRSN